MVTKDRSGMQMSLSRLGACRGASTYTHHTNHHVKWIYKEKKRQNNARTFYQHEYEPVIQMPNTTSRVVT